LRFRSILAGAVALILGVGGIVVGADPVRADPPGNPKDSTLSALSITGSGMTSIAPGFAPGTRLYEVVSNDDSTGALTATPAANTATVVVTVRSTTIPRTSGVATVPLIRGRNDITITVTSFDQTSTTVYTLVAWRHVAPTPGIAALPPIKTLPYGGQHFDVLLSDGALPDGCTR
jgi:hypothetical protein